MKLPQQLTHSKTKEQIAELELMYNQCALLFVEIANVLQKEQDKQMRASDDTNRYEMPAWSEFQADAIGYRRGLAFLKKLLPTDEELYRIAVSREARTAALSSIMASKQTLPTE